MGGTEAMTKFKVTKFKVVEIGYLLYRQINQSQRIIQYQTGKKT
jgi:hypothetical protein